MPSIKDLKKRIGSVRNTQQTTRAMKMVSAAKLRRAQEAIQNHRPYAQRIGELIQLVSTLQEGEVTHPLLASATEPKPSGARRTLLVLMTSDRGLCGAFNSSVIKAAQRWMSKHAGRSVSLAFVGRKGFDFFKARHPSLGPNFGEMGGKAAFDKSRKIADSLVELFVSGEFDEIKVVYNEFKNAVSQVVVVEDFLPLAPRASGAEEKEASQANPAHPAHPASEDPFYLVQPGAEALLEQLIERNFAIQVHRMLLESQASEHGARMAAMENATKNAGEMIRKLTLQYNKQRQAGITKELLEIISGSESQKG